MIGIIAAIGKNNELGKNGDLIWSLPNDLKFFKNTTMGKMVAMGKNTFNSLPKLLPGRKHVVLSLDDEFNKPIDDVIVFNEKDKFVEFVLAQAKDQDVFIIGGASVYSMFVPLVDEMYLTEIEAEDGTADVYFPKFDLNDWEREELSQGADGGVTYTHVRYVRKH